MADSPADPFGTARANLRDTIKWLAAALSGAAALGIGTSPLTSLGTLPLDGARFWFAAGSLAVALVAGAAALGRLLQLLIGDVFFLDQARLDPTLLDLVRIHHEDLLPPDFQDLTSMLDARRVQAGIMWTNRAATGSAAYIAAKARHEEFRPILSNITSLLHMERLRTRIRLATRCLLGCGIVLAFCLACFAWAANPPKPPAPPSIHQPVDHRLGDQADAAGRAAEALGVQRRVLPHH